MRTYAEWERQIRPAIIECQFDELGGHIASEWEGMRTREKSEYLSEWRIIEIDR